MSHSRKPRTLEFEYKKTLKNIDLCQNYSRICCCRSPPTTAKWEFERESKIEEFSVFCGMQFVRNLVGRTTNHLFILLSLFFFSCNTSLLLVVVHQLQPFLRHNDKEKNKRAGGTSTAVLLLLETVRRRGTDREFIIGGPRQFVTTWGFDRTRETFLSYNSTICNLYHYYGNSTIRP